MPESRCKYTCNRLINFKHRKAARIGYLFKLLHADPDISQLFGSVLDTDLVPYILYSLNRQKRWEFIIDQSLLEILQTLNQNVDIMVFERVSECPWLDNYLFSPPHYSTGVCCSKIKRSWELSKDGRYEETRFGGVGRFYGPKTGKKVQRQPTTMEVVTYNIVQEPKNFRKIFAEDIQKCKWDRHNPTYLRKGQFDPKSVKFDMDEFYEDFDNILDSNDENEQNPADPNPMVPRQHYDFMDHFVKTRRRKPRRTSILNDFVII